MTHDELVEKVALAIWPEDYAAMKSEAINYSAEPNGHSAWKEVVEMRRRAGEALAVVYEAMREPTPGMIRNAKDEFIPLAVPMDKARIFATRVWRTAISASPLNPEGRR